MSESEVRFVDYFFLQYAQEKSKMVSSHEIDNFYLLEMVWMYSDCFDSVSWRQALQVIAVWLDTSKISLNYL